MLALLAAVTMAAAPVSVAVRPNVLLASPSVACKPQGRYQADWAADPAEPALARREGRARPERLDRMPKPNLEKAVMRTVGGCGVPVIVAYSVGR